MKAPVARRLVRSLELLCLPRIFQSRSSKAKVFTPRLNVITGLSLCGITLALAKNGLLSDQR
jgi:hypothetical protein